MLFRSNPTCGSTCNGSATVTVSGGLSPYTYQWTNSSGSVIGSTQTISNICPGDYFVRVTDNRGCSSLNNRPLSNKCLEIKSILVQPCLYPSVSWDKKYEMAFFQVGPDSLDASLLSVIWPNGTWEGLCTNDSYEIGRAHV